LERWLGRKSLAAVRTLEFNSYHAIVACVASGTGVALLPESVLDVARTDEVALHPLPAVLAEIVTPLIWRAGETSPSLVALQEIVEAERNAPKRLGRRR
jgi:DNA-binding transcriptional LysR family regulator